MDGGEGDPIIADSDPSSKSVPVDFTPVVDDGTKQVPKFLNCPPGMDVLFGTEVIVVQQEVDELDVFSGYETNNKYKILDSFGKIIYYAVEQTTGCFKNCLRSSRPFKMIVMNSKGQEALHLERSCKCCCFLCFGKCCNEVQVLTAQEESLGKISQNCGFFSGCCPSFTLKDAENKKRLKIKGSCAMSTCCTAKFVVQTTTGENIGDLSKEWGGFGREVLTKANNYGVQFPRTLEIIDKTLLLACVMLVDMMYFERK